MPVTPGQGPEQGITPPPSPEHGPREIKQFPITVDGERTHYTESYPFSFIADGPIASIRKINGLGGDRTKLQESIDTFLAPSQAIFSGNTPDWYKQTIEPLLNGKHLSLHDMRPENIKILGDNFRSALERLWDFPIPEELRTQAAREMGQTEGTIPTLSELIATLKKADSQKLSELLDQLIAKGPDGFVMAAFLAAPEQRTEKTTPAAQDVSFEVSDKVDHPENYKLNEPKPEE